MDKTNKIKVGDIVRVKSREEIKNIKSDILFDVDMKKFCGMYMEIDNIIGDKYIKLAGDVGEWSWDARWLEAVSRKEQLKEEIEERQRELSKIYEEEKLQLERGCLDDINTWEEAIKKLKKLGYSGLSDKIVLMDGNIHFDLTIYNNTSQPRVIPKFFTNRK